MKHELRLGSSLDQPSIELLDEFGGDRQREIQAGCLFVAVINEEVVGYISYEARGLLGQPFLTYLCVHKEHRRQGIATDLVRFVQGIARGRKLISSTEDWCIDTQNIFEKLGWQRVGHISGINKDGSDEIFYAIAIDA